LLAACEPRSSVAHPQIFPQKIGGGVISRKENRLLAVFTHWQLIKLVTDHRTSATDQLAQDHTRGFGRLIHRAEDISRSRERWRHTYRISLDHSRTKDQSSSKLLR
jgi:hypothetical protein